MSILRNATLAVALLGASAAPALADCVRHVTADAGTAKPVVTADTVVVPNVKG